MPLISIEETAAKDESRKKRVTKVGQQKKGGRKYRNMKEQKEIINEGTYQYLVWERGTNLKYILKT